MLRVAAIFVILFSIGVAHAAARPNVLLICVDDLKPMLGCYGDTTVKSPNIDGLAGRGILFDRAYCNQAVCAPSRNSLLTGLRPPSLGIYDLGTNFRLAAPDAVPLPQYFHAHGCHTEGSFFKLLKSAGLQLEDWKQQTADTVARRLLVASMACVVVWQLAHVPGY